MKGAQICLFAVLLVTLGTASALAQAPQRAEDVDWSAIKNGWDLLTPGERAAYKALSAELASKRGATARRSPDPTVPGDQCTASTLEVGALPFVDSNDTTAFGDDYLFGAACGGFDENSGIGPDVAYRVMVDQSCDILVDMDPTDVADLALWVITDCMDPVGGCVGGDDSGGGGTAEQVSFTASAGTEYFILIDGFLGDAGPFNLTVSETSATGCSLVPVELEEFKID